MGNAFRLTIVVLCVVDLAMIAWSLNKTKSRVTKGRLIGASLLLIGLASGSASRLGQPFHWYLACLVAGLAVWTVFFPQNPDPKPTGTPDKRAPGGA